MIFCIGRTNARRQRLHSGAVGIDAGSARISEGFGDGVPYFILRLERNFLLYIRHGLLQNPEKTFNFVDQPCEALKEIVQARDHNIEDGVHPLERRFDVFPIVVQHDDTGDAAADIAPALSIDATRIRAFLAARIILGISRPVMSAETKPCILAGRLRRSQAVSR